MYTVIRLLCLVLVSLHLKCLVDAGKCFQDYSFGECVPVMDCDHLVIEINEAGNPIPLYITAKIQHLSCGYNGTDLLVCCIPPEDTYIEEKPQTRNVKDITEIPDIQNHPNLGLLPTNCGVGNENRIFGGTRAALFEMPWMVLLSYESVLGTRLDCDGTLINEWYVLTAAHCVKQKQGLRLTHVRLGELDLDHNPDCQVEYGIETCAPEFKTVAIAEVIAHPGYNKESVTNDIAILRLSEPADFTLDSIKPICLPLTPKLQQENILGKNMIVAGWGKTEQDTDRSTVLLKVFVPVVSKEVCQNVYTSKIHNYQICAGGDEGKDSCQGDSGGPLMDLGRLGSGGVKTIQRGIVSFGKVICGQAGIPAVYTNVAYFMDWILDNMHS